jgi:alpha-tubulin suppressor-like RCC1 family protein
MAHRETLVKGKLLNKWSILLFVSLLLFTIFSFALYKNNLSAHNPAAVAVNSSTKNFGTAYTVTRVYASKNTIVMNNLWRSSVQLAGGGYNNCALSNGDIYCWGKGTNGQLGNGANTSVVTSPVGVSKTIINGQRWTNIAGGKNHMCAVNSGLAACWGDNTYGQLGNGPNNPAAQGVASATTNQSAPVRVATFSNTLTPSKIAAGSQSTCAIADNQAFCWGDNSRGQLGDNSTTARLTPTALSSGRTLAPKATAPADALYSKSITQIQVGGLFACAIANGSAYCWGDNTYGQLGDNSTTQRNVPVAVNTGGVLSGKTVTQIALGNEHACAIADGNAYCWGRNNYGQLGTGNTTNSSVPVAVSTSTGMSGKVITNILNGGYSHTCAVADGQAYCWGRNNIGQLGDNTTTDRTSPVAVNVAGVLSGKGVTQLIGGDSYTCAVANGRAYCWGDNSFGQLGINSATPANTTIPYRVNDGYY